MHEFVSFMYLWLKIYGLYDIKKLTTVEESGTVANRSDKLRGNMKNNLKVLFIQLCVLAIGCFIGEAVFGLPKWLGLVIAGLMFYLVFFII